MSSSQDAYIALGANLGHRRRSIQRALQAVDALPNTRLVATSELYETAAQFVEDQPDFLNGCAHLKTTLGARELLDALLAIEHAMGRVRGRRNGPRVIDLDLLLYGDEIVDEEGLIVPHPDLQNRSFVLKPLVEIAADRRHPVLDLRVSELWRRLAAKEAH